MAEALRSEGTGAFANPFADPPSGNVPDWVAPSESCAMRTNRAKRAICETLKAGDLVPTRFQRSHAKIDSYVVPRGGAVRPVWVARSALDDNVPAADLWLTARHSLYVDGVLISVVNLVNDTTIAFDDDAGGDELEFFHIELATHDVIDAEGAASGAAIAAQS